ncbi:MAG: tetratricopeptide repeat protein [Candidatus Omnitrophota bacterium]
MKFSLANIPIRFSAFSVLSIFLVLGFLTFGQSISHPFVHDDLASIVNNPDIARWNNLSTYFLNPSALFRSGPNINLYYRPLSDIFSKSEYFFFGLNPRGYHVINILLHVLNSFLIFYLLNLVMREKKIALGVALLFLIHPSQTESVTYISGVSDLLFSLFCIGGLIFYILSVWQERKYAQNILYGLFLLIFAVALLIKEQSVALLFLVILFEAFIQDKAKELPKTKFVRLSGAFIIFLGYLLLRQKALGSALPSLLAYKGEWMLKLLSVPRILLTYLRIILFPVDLHFYRTVDILKPVLWPWLGFLLCLILIVLLLRAMPKAQLNFGFFAIAWFFAVLLPVCVVPMLAEYSYAWTPEHFLYLPLAGFFLFVVLSAQILIKRFFKQKAAIASVSIFLTFGALLSVITIKQNSFWKDEETLFKRSLKAEDQLGRVHTLLAKTYFEKGKQNYAIEEYKQALRIMNDYAAKAKTKIARDFYLELIKEIHMDLAMVFSVKRNFQEAIKELQSALSFDPSNSAIHNNLGLNFLYAQQLKEAKAHFQEAIRLDAANVRAMSNLAVCYIQSHQEARAKELLRQALAIDNNFLPAKENLNRLMDSQNPK